MAGTGASRLLARGYQGAVYLTETAHGPVIVKKPLGRGPARAVRRAMLRREHGIYQRLLGIPGVPRCLGLWHGEELVLEFIAGRSLRELNDGLPDRDRFLAALLDLIQAVHGAGVAHGDLKRKDNILVGPGGRPYLIDFGTAVSAPPGAGWLRRLLFAQLRRMDLNAWIKLKYRGRWLEIDPADLQYHQPTVPERLARVVRRAWRAMTFRRQRKARRSGR
jgi:predicted Ser/Thr protein kinase